MIYGYSPGNLKRNLNVSEMAPGELAAAEGLVVEVLFADYLAAALLQAALAPVLRPPGYALDLAAGPLPGLVDLFQALPAGRRQRGREHFETVCRCILCCAQESELEAFKAAGAALWGVFKSMNAGKPRRVVVAVIHHLEAKLVSISEHF